jgi:hypothetical protein
MNFNCVFRSKSAGLLRDPGRFQSEQAAVFTEIRILIGY